MMTTLTQLGGVSEIAMMNSCTLHNINIDKESQWDYNCEVSPQYICESSKYVNQRVNNDSLMRFDIPQ